MPNRIPTPGVKTPVVRKSPMAQKAVTGDAAVKAYQREISPSGMASAKAAQSKAMDKKYPGLYKTSKPTPKPTAKTSKAPLPIKVAGGGIIAVPKKPKPGLYKY